MRYELGEQIIKTFVELQGKTYSYLKENNDENKKAEGTKKCAIKRNLKFQTYKNCLKAALLEETTNCLEKKDNN